MFTFREKIKFFFCLRKFNHKRTRRKWLLILYKMKLKNQFDLILKNCSECFSLPSLLSTSVFCLVFFVSTTIDFVYVYMCVHYSYNAFLLLCFFRYILIPLTSILKTQFNGTKDLFRLSIVPSSNCEQLHRNDFRWKSRINHWIATIDHFSNNFHK